MKELHFSKTYFKKEIFDDPYSKIRVVIKEIPCIEISEEEYSLRISTRFEDVKSEDIKSGDTKLEETKLKDAQSENIRFKDSEKKDKPKSIYRDYAIEHHLPPAKHSFPHLQFKFHTEGVGQFRVRIDVADMDEYKKAILGFIYQIKNILNELETHRKGITEEMLVVELVDTLKSNSDFLVQKMMDGINKYALEFDKEITSEKISNLNQHPLLPLFLGKDNVELIIESQKKIKKMPTICNINVAVFYCWHF